MLDSDFELKSDLKESDKKGRYMYVLCGILQFLNSVQLYSLIISRL